MEEQVFDRPCIDVWRAERSGKHAIRAANLIVGLASLHAGSHLIDFGCGVGQIACALAERGIRVTGIDRSHDAIAEAKRTATNSLVNFIEADWRTYVPNDTFNCALFWYTTLCAGYERDLLAISTARQSLHSTGILLIETRHWDRMVRRFQDRSERRTDESQLIEEHTYDPTTGLQTTDECYVSPQRTVRRRYQTRRYAFAELREMCFRAGFNTIEGFDEHGSPLSNESERAILRATASGVAK
ncbi:MAG: methyltransferase domain-containing protein [Rhizobiales bacterium]|nr:methyltransferase domain-containing protein [Hyphomicrobiales bacterium]